MNELPVAVALLALLFGVGILAGFVDVIADGRGLYPDEYKTVLGCVSVVINLAV